MASVTNYSVLIQVQSQNEAERIISLFRAASINIRAHRVTSQNDLDEHINDEHWDLLILDNRHPEVSLSYSLAALKNSDNQTAIVLLTDDVSGATHKQAFGLGIHDVILNSADEHFIHACQREILACRSRVQSLQLEKEFNELQQHAEKLMSDSNDAIAYVSDGILISSNEAFAEAFSYDDIDDLDCASIIDLVAESDHSRFKSFLKAFTKGELEQAALSFQGIKQNGDTFDAHLSLEHASIDNEPCIQVNIATEAIAFGGSGAGAIDSATHLYNRYYLADQLSNISAQVCAGSLQASLMIYHVDDYERLLSDIFISGMDTLIRDLATHLEDHTHSGDIIARLDSDTVALISQQPTESALKAAKESLKSMDDHILELEGRTLQYTCTCAILNINNKNTDELLDQTVTAINQVRLNNEKNSAEIFIPATKQKVTASAEAASSIEDALESNQLRLLFAPIMSLRGDDKENYEVHMSQFDGEKDIYPQGLIEGDSACKLDRWIIIEATKALALQIAEGHNTRLIINLTVNALLDKTLAPWLAVAIKAANLANESIIFQFSEADIRKNLKAAITCFDALKSQQCQVSIANFGEEEEALKLLKHLSIDLIRIAPRFTTAVTDGKDAGELKQLLTDVAEHNIQTILPEVKNAGVLATLWQLGTHYIEGSYLQLPSPDMTYVFAELA